MTRSLRIVTWNVNSVRLRLDLVARLVERCAPDILCLQEIKCANGQFPEKALRKLGFDHVIVNGQKGYHGVATLSRLPIAHREQRDFNGTDEARHLAVEVDRRAFAPAGADGPPLVIHNFYVPAGGDVPDPDENPKFAQKLAYLDAMARWLRDERRKAARARERTPAPAILLGDLNVAPLETDVWSHRQLLKVVSHTPVEVAHLERVMAAYGWVDAMRHVVPPQERLFTWWSYRARDWRASNRGRRLDHVWVTPGLEAHVREMAVLDEARDWPRPSDHAPVLLELAATAT